MLIAKMHDTVSGVFMIEDENGLIKAGMSLPCEDYEPAHMLMSTSQEAFDMLCKFAQEFWTDGRVLFDRSTSLYKNASKMSMNSITLNVGGIVRCLPADMTKTGSIASGLSKEDELSYWRMYKRGDNAALNELVRSFKPLVHSRIKPWTTNSPLPKSAVEAEGIRLLKMGLDTYDPDKGAALNTHVWNYLNKIHRYGYTYQNVGSLPEPRAAKVGTYQNTFEQMKDDLGREPTIQELKSELGWKASDLKAIQEELRADLSLDQEIGPIYASNTDPAVEALMATYYDADPEKKLVMEYTFDEFKDKPTIRGVSNIAKHLDQKPNRIRKMHKEIYDSVSSILNSQGPKSLNLPGLTYGFSF